MRLPRIRIIDRYVAREVAGPLMLGVALLTFALVTGRLLKLTEMVVNRGVSLGEVFSIIGYIMPAFLELTFPMAVLLGVLLGFGRMSAEQEITAARSCGISLYRLAVPVLAIGVLVWAIAGWFAFSVRPWSNQHLSDLLYHISRTRTTAGLKEKVFNHTFPGIVLYVDHISPDNGSLHGVMISDDRTRGQHSSIIAREGLVLPDKNRETVTLRLFAGSVFGMDSEKGASHITSFKVYDLNLQPDAALSFADRAPDQMSYGTLLQTIAKARAAGRPNYLAETELAGKYTIPFASVLFALLGIPLGLKPARGGQSERFGVSIALFFFYYAMMRVGENLAQGGRLSAFAAMGIPDLLFAAFAGWLFVQSAGDRTDQGRGPGDILWDLVERFERSRQAA
ncbi:MAG: LPS export ABC transporter permease LptF [Candidatus Binataceae bacterium]|nr:LPS export ABC transporter permease LptF [Candidatus Binataceae bacterium]